MPPRLLSLLSLIESELPESSRFSGIMRWANYHRGTARMTFADGSGSIVLQSFQLADGQLCLRVDFCRAEQAEANGTAIYPQTASFDWSRAAARIARAWCTPVESGARQVETLSA